MNIQKRRSIKVDDATWERLENLSKESGKSMSSYIRALINHEKPKSLPNADFFNIYTELSVIANKFYEVSEIAVKEKSVDYEKFKDVIDFIHKLRRDLLREHISPDKLEENEIASN